MGRNKQKDALLLLPDIGRFGDKLLQYPHKTLCCGRIRRLGSRLQNQNQGCLHQSLPRPLHEQHARETHLTIIIGRLFIRSRLLHLQCRRISCQQIHPWCSWKLSHFLESATTENGYPWQPICWLNEKGRIHHHELPHAEKWSSFSPHQL